MLLYNLNCSGFDVTLVWIPSHRAVQGNERADRVAGCSTSLGTLGFGSIPFQNCLHGFKKSLINETITYTLNYGRSRVCRRYMEVHPGFSLTPWFDRVKQSRKNICLLNRLKSHHVRSRHYLFQKNIINNDLCDCGEDFQDVDHLVWWCPLLAMLDRNLWNGAWRKPSNWNQVYVR